MGKFWKANDFNKVKDKEGTIKGLPCKVVAISGLNIVVLLESPKPWALNIPKLRRRLGIKRRHQPTSNNLFVIATEGTPVSVTGIEPEFARPKFITGDVASSPLGNCTILGQCKGDGTFHGYVVRLEKELGWSSHPSFPNYRSNKNDLAVFFSWQLKKPVTPATEYTVRVQDTKVTVFDSAGNKGISRCHPDDDFNLGFGINLAVCRCKGYTRWIPKEGEEYYHVGSSFPIVFKWNNEVCYNDVLVGNIFMSYIDSIAFAGIVRDNRTKLLKKVLDEKDII